MDSDIFDGLLQLEDEFYNEGYKLGVTDGAQAGYAEGNVFAIEKAFEKLLEFGRLYGKGLVWAQRLAVSEQDQTAEATQYGANIVSGGAEELSIEPAVCREMPCVPKGTRLRKNVRVLLEQVDPATLSLDNTPDAITEVEERLKGAVLKAKLIQRAFGERETASDSIHLLSAKDTQTSGDGSGSIEDSSSLRVRH
ncbi:hypothetical protein V8E54_004482 [Elaphomyces granulatus]|jgi:hypothetical protein